MATALVGDSQALTTSINDHHLRRRHTKVILIPIFEIDFDFMSVEHFDGDGPGNSDSFIGGNGDGYGVSMEFSMEDWDSGYFMLSIGIGY